MGFIFGIVNYNGNKVETEDVNLLKKGVSYDGFESKIISGSFYSGGVCRNSEKNSHTEIFRTNQFTIIADIKLFNVRELKSLFVFKTFGEAFLKSYLEWGEDCANHLNGDFSVVLIDEIRQKVVLFRDHIGVRPLTFYFDGEKLIFASHEFGIAKSGLVPLRLCKETAINRLFKVKEDYSKTVFQDILRLKPGHIGVFSKKDYRLIKYWNPGKIKINHSRTYLETVKGLRTRIVNATLLRIEEGNIGVHVSGGLDSTSIACILAGHIDDKSRLTGYSWTPEYPTEKAIDHEDEKPFIEDFVREKGIEVKYLQPDEAKKYVDDSIIPEFETQHIEHPTMRMASKDNINILFSGWGGDEFVSLSLRGVFGHLFFRFRWLTLLKYIKSTGIRSAFSKFRSEVLSKLLPFGLVPAYSTLNWKRMQFIHAITDKTLIKCLLLNKGISVFSTKGRRGLMLNQINMYYLPKRMDSWAIYAEKYGYEYRYPLLDKELLEFWFSIPPDYTFKDFKKRVIFKDALDGILPDSIRLRTEKGEMLRISDMLWKYRAGFSYMAELLDKVPKDCHISFFRHDAFKKEVEWILNNKHRTMKQELDAFYITKTYLRYINLYQKYFINKPDYLKDSRVNL